MIDPLKRVETDEAIAIVWLDQQKYDRRDNGEVGKHAGYIFLQRRGRSAGTAIAGRRRRWRCRRACTACLTRGLPAVGTERRIVCHLGTAGCTKCHDDLPEFVEPVSLFPHPSHDKKPRAGTPKKLPIRGGQ